MRTTITFDADVAAAVDNVRHERHVGVSEVVNELIRLGLTSSRDRTAFHQETASMGLKIDVANVAEAMELLDGPHGH